MEPIDDPAVDTAFRAALRELKGRLLAGVITSIGTRRDIKAVPALKQLLKDPDSNVQTQILSALGTIATPEAIQTIRAILTEGPQNLRTPAADACLKAADQLASTNQIRPALVLYDTVRAADVPKHLRSAATYRAILTEFSHSIPLLIQQLNTLDPAMVEMALRAARQLPGHDTTKALADELPNLNPHVQALLIKALLDRNDPTVLKSIQNLAASKHPQVRTEALKALGKIGNADSVPVLLKATETQIALTSLRTIDAPGVDQAIVTGMKKANAKQKPALIEIITARRVTTATPALLTEASSKEPAVAIAAFKALAQLATPKELPAMIKLVINLPDGPICTQAETAIVALALKIPDQHLRTDDVLFYFSASGRTDHLSLYRILGKIANDKAVETLKIVMDTHENPNVRDTALRALAASDNPAVLGPLLEIIKTTSNRTNRTLALRGLIRLLALDTNLSQQAKLKIFADVASKAENWAEKQLILGGLSKLTHPGALDLTLPWIYDPAIKHEVVFATLKIAKLTAGAAPDRAKRALLLIERQATSPELKQQARALADVIDNFDDYIVAWQVTKYYTDANRDHNTLLWMGFEPETPDNKAQWSLMPAATDPARPWILNLLELYPGNNRVAYARTCIISEKQQPAILELGSDDGVKAWLNGKLVHNHSVARAAVPATDKVNITLQPGPNKLMLKISQNVSAWEFCARIRNPQGGKLEGIKIDCLHEPAP
jgi:HEAT repeat protein